MAIYSNVITNSSGSVGIGTTDVKEKLQVYGDLKVGVLAAGSFISLADESSTARYVGIYRSAGDTLLGLGAWGGIKFHASNTSLGSQTEWMRLDTSGRLGIGVTNPTSILTINKGNGTGINVQYDNSTNVRSGLFLFTRGSSIGGFSGGSEWDDSTTTARSTAASALLASAGTLLFYTNTSLTSGNTFTPSERMRIDTSGNVGIGQTNPGNLLTVNQASNTSGGTTTSYGFMLNNQGTARLSIGNDGTNTLIQSWSSNPLVINAQGNNISLGGSAAGPNTAVGVGTPNARLHVQGSTTTSTPTLLVKENQAMATATATFDVQNSAGSSLFFVSGSGNIGIGTNVPTSYITTNSTVLAIAHTGNVATVRVSSGPGLSSGNQVELFAGTDRVGLWGTTNVPMLFYTNTTEKMRITSGGDVGIGTSSYTGRLYVSGSSTSATPTIVGRAGIPAPSGALLDLQNNEGTTAFLVNYQGSVRAGTSGAGMVLDFRTNGANRLDLQFSDGASWYVNPDRSTGSFINFFENTLGAQVYIGNRNADAVNTLRNGSPLYLSTRYWNGSASVAVSPSIQALVDSTSPDYRLNLTAGSGNINIRSNGYIGIGKTNPAYTLDVTGDINYTSALKLGGVNVLFNTSTDVYANIRVLQNNSTSSQDGMYINYNSTGTSAANLRFYANGTNLRMQIDAATGHTLPGTDNAYDLGTSGVRWRTLYLSNTLSAATVTASGLTQGSIVFAGSGGTLSQDNTKLFWDNSNKRLGIGNSAPGYPLDVTGTSRYTGIAYYDGGESINLYGIRGRFSGEAMHLYNKVAIGYPSGWGGDISTTPIYGLSTYGGAILAYNQGTVGIGTATSSVRLYVHGSSTATTPTMLVKEGVASPTNGVLAFEVEKSTGATIFAVSGSGFVGVGTSNPAGTFEVVGVSGSLLLVTDNLSGSLFSVNDVTGLPILEVFSDDTVVAGRVNTNALVVTGSIVGVGTRTPSNTLDVNGTVRVRSVSNATGNFATYSGTGVLQQRTAAEVKTDLSLNNVQNLSVSQIFNNTGAVHGTRSDFANITDFGYQYVQGSTNGPNLNSATQYYAWTIGLGSEYSYANYGAQFAIPRAVTNPYMGVRFREATTWSSWHKLAAGNADILTTARTLWGQSFDGSGNVTGNLTSVGNITGNSGITLTAAGTLSLVASGANVITATTNGTEALRIDSSQNVGIGTATAGTRLHVYSGATDEVTRFESTGNPYISLYDTGVRQGYLYSNTSSVELVAENSKPLYLQGATEIRLRTNTTTDRVIINSGGVVGINYTPPVTTAVTKLMVSGDIGMPKANAALLGNLYYDTAVPGWKYGANGYGWGFREDNAGLLQMVRAGNNTSGANAAASISLTDLFTFDLVNNRVGLGTGSPSTKFHVLHSSNDPVMIEQTTDAAWNRIYFKKPTRSWTLGPDNSTGTNNLFVLADETAGAYRVTVDTSGNVGINTSSMSRKLVVHGSDALINSHTVGRGSASADSTNAALGSFANSTVTSGQYNTAVGFYANRQSNGGENTAVGYVAMDGNTASYNTAVGSQALYAVTSGPYNTAVGYKSLYSAGASNYSVGVGAEAGYGGNSAGRTAIGYQALAAAAAAYTTAVGYRSLNANTTGVNNVGLGAYTLEVNDTGDNNTAVGANALLKLLKYHRNTAVGAESMANSTQGQDSVAVGYKTLYSTSTDVANVAVGSYSLQTVAGGSYNVGIGYSSLYSVSTGGFNVAVGPQAGTSITSGGGNVVIGGYGAGGSFATQSNNIFIADGNATLRMMITSSNGGVGIGTTSWPGGVSAGTTTLHTYRSAGNSLVAQSATNASELDLIGRGTSDITGSVIVTGGTGVTPEMQLGSITSHALAFFTNNSRAMTVDTSQRVGVGTGTPDTTANTKLHVYNGNAIFNNTYGVNWTGLTGPTNGTRTGQTLDHYDYGTWTPAFAGSSSAGTYTLTNTKAYYVRVGKLVVVSMYTEVSAISPAGTGDWRITGLPYSSSSGIGIASVGKYSGLATNVATISGVVEEGNTYVEMYVTTANAAANTKAAIGTYVGTSTKIAMTITFRVS